MRVKALKDTILKRADGTEVSMAANDVETVADGVGVRVASGAVEEVTGGGDGGGNTVSVNVVDREGTDYVDYAVGIAIPKSITSIADYNFYNDGNIESVKIPSSVKKIGANAFQNCTRLKNIIFNEGLEEIDTWAFDSCVSLETVILPSTVTRLNGNTFMNCSNLRYVYIPSSVTTIAHVDFQGVTGTIECGFAEGAVAGAPWGALEGTIIRYSVPDPSNNE